MFLKSVHVKQVRNLDSVEIKLAKGINFFQGLSGSGKTSILESIYVALRGKSFRARRLDKLIPLTKQVKPQIDLVAISDSEASYRIQFSLNDSAILIRINERPLPRLSQLARLVPVQFFGTSVAHSFFGMRQERSAFLDWGLFHVKHDFHDVLIQYNRCLKQRNEALKQNNHAVIKSFTGNLIQLANKLDEYRAEHIKDIGLTLCKLAQLDLELRYSRGWSVNRPLVEVLESNLQTDIKRGFTSAGPHYCNIDLIKNNYSLIDYCSNGERKYFLLLLYLAQIDLLANQTDNKPIFLLDDFDSEFSTDIQELFLSTLKQKNIQCLITGNFSTLELKRFSNSVFHVKHSKVSTDSIGE
ncbi:DNA replication and repair protein RecF [Magnetovirga frankeli]|uniref:DNA replication/repair protein RecF n=1 Tax=Magnetovirga frankeli TaxID=947516 RepID=UPI0012932EFC|nr:DNA replication and repair protein RecF [gamma proteobacterium SS-5]